MERLSAQEMLTIFDDQLKKAQQIQRKIIPKDSEFKSEFYRFTSHLKPFRRVGGDFYDFSIFEDGCASIILVDATGHGIDAAMLTSMVKLIYSYALRDRDIKYSPSMIIKQINDDIEQLVDFSFFSAMTILLDPDEGKIYWCNAGHPSAYIIYANGSLEQLSSSVPLIGMHSMVRNSYENMVNNFKKGDKLIMYTDGLIEARNRNNDQYGTARVEELIKRYRNSSLDTLLQVIINDLKDFTQGSEASDDICLLGIECTQ